MGKKKSVSERVKTFYRGHQTKPTKIANENDMQIIIRGLQECMTCRKIAYETTWRGETVILRVVAGLSAGLRCLKQKRTKALIYDDTAGPHLAKYLNEFANKLEIPVIRASRLIDIAPKFKLKNLLLLSVVLDTTGEEPIYEKPGHIKPNKLYVSKLRPEPLEEFWRFLQSPAERLQIGGNTKVEFKPAVVEKVVITGKSKIKKEARRAAKRTQPEKDIEMIGYKTIRSLLSRLPVTRPYRLVRPLSDSRGDASSADEESFKEEVKHIGVHLDDYDEIMNDGVLPQMENFYPKLTSDRPLQLNLLEGHNLVVIQPWVVRSNFGQHTTPDIQLAECVSLGNTIHNWKVIGQKIMLTSHTSRKQLVGVKAFEELKDLVLSHAGVTAVFFGVDILSGIQLATLEREFRMPVYDRFTVVLNIFRQHARTKDAKIQLALAELPYIRSNLREIHNSSEFSSAAGSLKTLVGGLGEKFFHTRDQILKRREKRLRTLLDELRKQRDLERKRRANSDMPVVSVVGYTNSGKTTLVRYMTHDERLVPEDKLFATLDVSAHIGCLPSSKEVMYLDTVGFISRIPTLLVEAFSATLKEVQESDLILHVLDVNHPDHSLQNATVIKALESLKVRKELMETKITIGNKLDLFEGEKFPRTLPKCDLLVSVTEGTRMDKLVEEVNKRVMKNIQRENVILRVENGGVKYRFLKKNTTITKCEPDEQDANYLICHVIMSPMVVGRWSKQFGTEDVVSDSKIFEAPAKSRTKVRPLLVD